MFYNLIPSQRKLSALFSQEMCSYLAPGRAACAQDWQRQPAPSQSSPGQMRHPRPTCANWQLATRKRSSVGMPCAGTSTGLCGQGAASWGQGAASWGQQNPEQGFSRLTGGFGNAGAELQPGKEGGELPAQHGPERERGPRSLCPNTCQPHLQKQNIHYWCDTNLCWTEVNSHTWLNHTGVCMEPQHKTAAPAPLVSVPELSHGLFAGLWKCMPWWDWATA